MIFPKTPHLVWLTDQPLREDKIFSVEEQNTFLTSPGAILVEEKVDGTSIGLSLDSNNEVIIYNSGTIFTLSQLEQLEPIKLQGLTPFLKNASILTYNLAQDQILFGEWCRIKHQLHYTKLESYFIPYEKFDKKLSSFTPTFNPSIFLGYLTCPVTLTTLLSCRAGTSAFSKTQQEGIYLRKFIKDGLSNFIRAKIVNPQFVNNIVTHWSKDKIILNKLKSTCS